jgi:uncharacterized protein (TIGR03032 family)
MRWLSRQESEPAPVVEPSQAAARRPDGDSDPAQREVRSEYTRDLPQLLTRLGAAVLASTYQAGKLVAVGGAGGARHLSLHNFERAMGLAVRRDRLAVGAQGHIWFLRSAPDLAPRLEPAGRYAGCFVARAAYFTGDIHCHEMAWAGAEWWVVHTLFSCLCTLHADYSVVPRWQPPFSTALAAEDRCHLNGLALVEGRPQYVTALAETDTPQGWRPPKVTSGCLIEVATGTIVTRGLAMPHSPRVYQGRVWLLDSGTGRLVVVDPARGTVDTVATVPGYARGLACAGSFACVGLSKIRETSTFGGVPIAAERDKLKCGIAVVELPMGRQVAHLEFKAGVNEIFAVQVLPGMRLPAVSGPFPVVDGGQPIWIVAEPRPQGPGAARAEVAREQATRLGRLHQHAPTLRLGRRAQVDDCLRAEHAGQGLRPLPGGDGVHHLRTAQRDAVQEPQGTDAWVVQAPRGTLLEQEEREGTHFHGAELRGRAPEVRGEPHHSGHVRLARFGREVAQPQVVPETLS